MTGSAQAPKRDKKNQPRWRRWLRYAVLALLAFILLPYLLVPIYRFIDPPTSNLMLSRYIMLKPVEREWIDYEDLSTNLMHAVLMSEDARFCVHNGVDFDALWVVVESLDDEGRRPRGASTIAMQTAKNLFLWPGQNYIRKALEIPLALWIDFVWPKSRVLEVYLNIAEWGDGIFGAQAAARHHFGKTASSMSKRQAALLAVSLPNPIRRQAGKPSRGMNRLASRVQARMRAAGPWVGCLDE